VYKMLQKLFERQTVDEQSAEFTKYVNGRGFNGADANVLSDIAKKSIQYQNLTVKQAALVARRLKKYAGQLEEIALEKQLVPKAIGVGSTSQIEPTLGHFDIKCPH